MHVSRKFSALWGAAIAFSLVASPAAAQRVSDGYAFLKAVKDRDGAAATNLVATPGSVIINSTERDTGDGALHIIVRERDLTWLGFLLGKDARVDLQNDQGDTPLALAAQIGWVEGAQVLLGTRASVDLANNRGETPLILAVHRRDLPIPRRPTRSPVIPRSITPNATAARPESSDCWKKARRSRSGKFPAPCFSRTSLRGA